MIPQTFIDEIQARTDIVELISGYLPLKKAGRNFKALCPFHGEKTPSFVVNPQKQIFHCFGCAEGGSAIQFLMLYEKVSFVEAIEILAQRLGLTVPSQKGLQGNVKAPLYDAVHEAVQFFHQNLISQPATSPLLEGLTRRGIGKETIKQFRIGYASGNNSLIAHMRKKGVTLETMEKASLVVFKGKGYRDTFADRIIFPIYDVRGRALGFGGRRCSEKNEIPKYINSLENPLYSKRAHLFGLHLAKDEIKKSDSVVVVEGYLDMISPFMRGIKNIVASLGTALTPEQVRLMKRHTSHIILVFDADTAGQSAALRALDLVLEQDVGVEVVRLPKGYDPDSFVREKGKDAFLDLIAARQSFFDYKLDILKNTNTVESITGKTQIAKQMLLTIGKLHSEVEKFEYIKQLSGAIGVTEEILIAEYRNLSAPSGPVRSPAAVSRHVPFPLTEKILLKGICTNAKALAFIKRNLREEDFTHPSARKVIAYFFHAAGGHDAFSPSHILGTIDDKEVSGCVSSLLMDESIPFSKEAFKESVLKLRKKKIQAMKDTLREQIQKAEQNGDRQKVRILVDKYGKINSGVRNG
jgi:DNA primase